MHNSKYLIAKNDPWDFAAGKKKNGHGVGMSQQGCRWAAKHGFSYKEILNFYYPNTIISINTNESLYKIRELIMSAKEICERR